jgi:hypothetical protein
MGLVVLDSIPFKVDPAVLGELLRVRKGGPDEGALAALVKVAAPIARPRAVYRESFVDDHDDEGVTVDAVRFRSRLLGRNLKGVNRVFPYCATCGHEIEEWAAGLKGMKYRYWADSVMMAALGSALAVMAADVESRFRPGKMSFMNPGSLADWPLTEQGGLFSLIDGASIGVELTASCLMRPLKSVSGIMFPTEREFHSCIYCGKEKCPGRRAPYDPEAVKRDLHS